MDPVWNLVWDGVLALLCAVLSLGGLWLGKLLAGWKKALFSQEQIRQAAETAVKAAEQILGEGKGEEKMSLALDFAQGLLSEEGIECSRDRLEVLMEAALASFNGAFREKA